MKNRSLVRALMVASASCGALLLACGSPGRAPARSALSASAERGRASYETYCIDCHGTGGRGDGPLAAGMEPLPADLTSIGARRGSFVTDNVASYIDGRMDVMRHGPSDMPVWGRKLDDRMERSLAMETRLSPQTILEIVAYLETLQVK